jgi:hypothetical protein
VTGFAALNPLYLLRYFFDLRRQCRLELSERSLLASPENIPYFYYYPSPCQFMNSPVVVRPLGVKQLLHYINDLISPVSIASSPACNKLYGFVAIMFRKMVN